ncbi:MAG: isochorismatase family protein, partial [Nocardioides sp.]|nr:isochorismatase family protein [Nocardioides sp.]
RIADVLIGTGADLDPAPLEELFRKGEHVAAYSGFEGRSATGASLADWLRERGVDRVDLCGIATDHCVRATALDAVAEGFATRVLTDLVVGVAPATTEAALAALREAGVEVA